MLKHTFLVEIGTEELPPKFLFNLSEVFAIQISRELNAANVQYGEIIKFSSPRRLAVKVIKLDDAQVDRNVEKRGPTVAQSFDIDGNLTKIAKKWAHHCGILTINPKERLVTEKGEWLVYRKRVKGQPVRTLLCDIVNRALSKLPILKMMRWGDNDVQFVRPVHTVTMLLDDMIIPGKVLGVNVDRILLGHRFMGEQEIILEHADHYAKVLLERGRVMADALQRKEKIRQDVEETAKQLGGIADLNNNLLEEITALVEWPVVLTACFEEKFLAVPPEALVHIMKNKQKYIPVYDAVGNLMPCFIFVTNIESKNPQQIIIGNERVICPRLSDAKFFFDIDRKKRLEDHLSCLDKVLFQKKLGTLRDKSNRIEALSGWIAARISANISHAARAGLLSKCDLMTNIVFEFADIHGVMGMHYARNDGEPEAVALAQKEQYQPRSASDTVPTTLVSCAVSIADKIDTLVGIFGINQHPKGNKDPFSLRRAAVAVLRIIIEKNLYLDLQTLTEKAVRLYFDKLTNNAVVEETIDFMLNRFRSWYQEKGYSIDTINAVLARRPTRPADFDARIRAVSHFRTLEEATALAAANKRVSNILAKTNDQIYTTLQLSLLKDPVEIKLANHVTVIRKKLQPMLKNERYQDALKELTTLHEPINSFFEKVMVMVEDNKTRINRLTLLSQLRELFLQVADISFLK